MDEWQPIETAPKNPAGQRHGEWVLAWNDAEQSRCIVRWDYVTNPEGEWITVDDARSKIKRPGTILKQNHITHWMPLPTPPATGQEP